MDLIDYGLVYYKIMWSKLGNGYIYPIKTFLVLKFRLQGEHLSWSKVSEGAFLALFGMRPVAGLGSSAGAALATGGGSIWNSVCWTAEGLESGDYYYTWGQGTEH